MEIVRTFLFKISQSAPSYHLKQIFRNSLSTSSVYVHGVSSDSNEATLQACNAGSSTRYLGEELLWLRELLLECLTVRISSQTHHVSSFEILTHVVRRIGRYTDPIPERVLINIDQSLSWFNFYVLRIK